MGTILKIMNNTRLKLVQYYYVIGFNPAYLLQRRNRLGIWRTTSYLTCNQSITNINIPSIINSLMDNEKTSNQEWFSYQFELVKMKNHVSKINKNTTKTKTI